MMAALGIALVVVGAWGLLILGCRQMLRDVDTQQDFEQ